jgi:multicomponent Na+:H+ antiporter subunit G
MIAVVDQILDVVSAVLLIAGSGLALVASIGLVRLGDPRSRMHAATKPATLGVVMCGTGAILQFDAWSPITKLVAVIVLQLITVPVGAHALAHAITERENDGK